MTANAYALQRYREAFAEQARQLGLTTDQYADLLVKAILDVVKQRRDAAAEEGAAA